MGTLQANRKMDNIYIVGVYLFVFSVIMGNVISNDEIRFCGMVLSVYRVVIPSYFIYFLWRRIKYKSLNKVFSNRMLILYMLLMGLWIVWGVILIFISPYSQLREALKDILSLILAMLSIYSFWELCDTEKVLDWMFKCIRIICFLLCIWALIEILFGIYLPFSQHYWFDIVNKEHRYAVFLRGLKEKRIYRATTCFYNGNDLSSFLAIFLPLFYICKENTIKTSVIREIIFGLIIFIICVNDSNIALIGITLSLVIYFIFGERKCASKLLAILLFIQTIGAKLIIAVIIFIKSNLPIEVPLVAKRYGAVMDMTMLDRVYNVMEVMETQVANAMGGSANSLMCRWQITLTSLRMTLKSKLMGIGPSGFSNYIVQNEPNSKLVNPHNWWLEILSQYGIIVFIAYLFVMANIFFQVCKLYKNTKNNAILLYLCMCVVFCLACIAPSSYLNYSYQWILPAIGLSLTSIT